ncbi:type IX secretion system outer membrane channel protein PorV [Fulvivirgaceae bacterium BMA10]|uniref:Type IX secretion system outer membrane channel protein PorV n=1 Tax=Splendidivirga corallicola TaxID=3051826 RepID=A0ABT8KRR0_9BACT|nr:type IX secretion system outer membrane channel protein PorV [Fulvivirgaceae bacterium BMA10]
MKRVLTIFFITILLHNGHVEAQNDTGMSGQAIGSGVLNPGVPFLSLTPDARGSSLGESGAATDPDVYSLYWNNAKLVFIEHKMGGTLSYTPWLNKIANDMFISYVAGYLKIDDKQAIGLSLRYFNLGEFQINDGLGTFIAELNPYEVAVDATYSRKLTDHLSLGISGRFINSNISRQFALLEDIGAGYSVAIDLGVYYKKSITLAGNNADLSLGAHLSNFGTKINYGNNGNGDFIPTNLRMGTALRNYLDENNSLTFVFDINKLMIPTPPVYGRDESGNREIIDGKDPNRSLFSGTFGSFGDAPGGLSEELKELTFSTGLEYWYKSAFAVRAGYFHENRYKGDRQYLTFGLGFRYQVFGFDTSYLAPLSKNHPLAETLRFSVLFNFN